MVDVYFDNIPGKVGGCEILKSLGKGVMGQNLLAKDGKFTHVIKIINHEIVKRMSEAGKFTGEVKHANILPIKEYVVDDTFEEVYFMDYLNEMEHSSYSFFHEEGLKETFKVFQQVADAFDFAHKTGVSHNNLKPSNMLVKKRKKGVFPMITDFGFFLKYDGSQINDSLLPDILMYMAPEVIESFSKGENENVDFYKKGDMYAFGVMLCEALTGRPLFERCVSFRAAREEKTELQITMIGVNSPRDFIDIHALDNLVRRCVAYDPRDRFGTFTEIAALMTQLSDNVNVPES